MFDMKVPNTNRRRENLKALERKTLKFVSKKFLFCLFSAV